MMNIRYLFLIPLLSLSAVYSGNPSYAAEQNVIPNKEELTDKRTSFANNFANIVLAVISDHKKSYEARKENLANAFSKSVDIEWIAKFVIGRTWNKASTEQRERYTELYRKFLTKTYVENFAENPEKRINSIKIIDIENSESTSSDFTVKTQMGLASQEKMLVNYLVRETDGKYKVLDIAIENVSLITTHRAEFTALASAGGIDSVITKLAKLTGQDSNVTLSMK